MLAVIRGLGQGRDQRHVFSAISGNTAIGALAFGRAGIQRRESDIGPTLIHYDDVVGIELLDMLSIGCSCRFIAFAGPERLFFRVKFILLMARLMLHRLTCMPWLCSQY